jgi:hypothetical protein
MLQHECPAATRLAHLRVIAALVSWWETTCQMACGERMPLCPVDEVNITLARAAIKLPSQVSSVQISRVAWRDGSLYIER